jgi:hypothetical protein
VRYHPASGRTSLYLASHASHIIGWPVERGRALLEELIAFATQLQFVYQHRWTVGDLVIWDNRCTMHRGRPYDDTQRRVLHRTTVSDRANTLEQVGLVAISAACPGSGLSRTDLSESLGSGRQVHGIMLVLRLAMIQIEPVMTRKTIRTPNARARMLFVLSGALPRCRKKTR